MARSKANAGRRRRKVFDKKVNKLHGPVTITKTAALSIRLERFAFGELREQIYLRDAGQCQYCGSFVSYQDCNLDHVIPWPKGKTTAKNLVVACRDCNKLKGNQLIPEAYRPL